jgi:hypothetical protein
MKRAIFPVFYIAIAIFVLFGSWDGPEIARAIYGQHFTDSDILNIKESIRSEITKREGVTISDISLIRETNRKLVGFVKIKIQGLDVTMTKVCYATMSESGESLWACQ